jgi:hypothetical protein
LGLKVGVGEDSFTKLRPGWGQVLSSFTVQLCTVVQMICEQIVNKSIEDKNQTQHNQTLSKNSRYKTKRAEMKQTFLDKQS